MKTCQRCPAVVHGNDHVCGRCRDADRLCRDCGREHGGGYHTRFCAPCRARRRAKPVKHTFAPAMDEAIRQAYAENDAKKALDVLERRLGRARWAISKRAQRLGCATVAAKPLPWSPEELEILERWAWMVADRVRLKLAEAGFARSTTAVAIQLKHRRLKDTVDGTSAHALAELIGHDPTTVTRWIKQGKLKAVKRGEGDRIAYYVTDDAFRAFVLRHVELVHLGKIERAGAKLWLVDLLSGGKVGGKRAA